MGTRESYRPGTVVLLLPAFLFLPLTLSRVAKAQEMAEFHDDGDAVLVQLSQRQGDISLKTWGERRAWEQVTRILRNGKVKIRSQQEYDLEFEVPRSEFDKVWESLKRLENIESSHEKQVDLSAQYSECSARLRFARHARETAARLPLDAAPTTAQEEIRRWDRRIEEFHKDLERIEEKSRIAIIRVHLLPQPRYESAGTALHLSMLGTGHKEMFGRQQTVMAVGLDARGMMGAPLGRSLGLDARAGASLDGGIYVEGRVLMGLGAALGRRASLGLAPGIGTRGLSRWHIPFAVEVPLELFGYARVTDTVQWKGWARGAGVFGEEMIGSGSFGPRKRKAGTESVPFFDEFSAGTSLLFGWSQSDDPSRRTGPYLAGAYHELMGQKVFEISMGVGMSLWDVR